MELEAASRDHLRESRLNSTGDTASLTGQKANVTLAAQAGGVRCVTANPATSAKACAQRGLWLKSTTVEENHP